jgi:hypothetical protein
MRKLLFIAAAFFILSSSKCKKDDETLKGNISLNIATTYNNSPLIINKMYDYNGKKIRFTKLSFFVSYINAVNSSSISAESPYKDIAFFDFTSLDDSIKALKGSDITYNQFVDKYVSIKMDAGVNKSLNAKKPKDYPSSSPLSDAGNYWDDWNSYIFLKLEGLIDKDGDGKLESGITLHTGGNEVYQPLSFPKSFSVSEGQTTTLSFNLDLNKLLTGIDLTTINATHQTGDLPTMKKLMGNFPTALTLK